MVEEAKNEYVEGKEVKITSIDLDMFTENKDEIRRITFVTDVGNITWKPKIQHEEFQNGFKLVKKIAMSLSFMPEKLEEMAKLIAENNSVRVKAHYYIFEKEIEGETSKYRYISSIKTFDKWEIIK